MRQQQSHGELDEQWPVFPELRVEAPIVLDRELSETCAVAEACSPLPRLGDVGTAGCP